MLTKRRIKASEVSRDIRSGMTNVDLRKKYRLSFRELQKVLAKVRLARRTRAREFLKDVRAGMQESELMGKYRIALDQLLRALRKLVRSKVLLEEEVQAWQALDQKSVGAIPIRKPERCRPRFQLPIFEKRLPDNSGLVIDLTEKGVGLSGVKARVNEIKTFIIPADEFSCGPPVEFEARCCWAAGEENAGGASAGFQITAISEKSLEWLRQFIHLATRGA